LCEGGCGGGEGERCIHVLEVVEEDRDGENIFDLLKREGGGASRNFLHNTP